MSEPQRITTPLDDAVVSSLRAGDSVLICGTIYAARDQAHLRMLAALERGEQLPFDAEGAVIYYVGPTPPREGQAVGAAGPTTSARMDALVEPLFAMGVRATMGKGPRGKVALDAMRRHRAIYLAATGGAGALLGSRIVSAETLAYEDLGPEALRRMVVKDFPALVAIDTHGGNIFETGPAAFTSS